jgi:hypothetical protein
MITFYVHWIVNLLKDNLLAIQKLYVVLCGCGLVCGVEEIS